jgi:hypothetical protein
MILNGFDYATAELGALAHAEFHGALTLPAFGGKGGRLAKRPPRLRIQTLDAYPGPGAMHGEASRQHWSVTIYLWPRLDACEVRQTVLHELTHLCRRECWDHRRAFKDTLAQAALEAWGVDCTEATRRPYRDLDTALVAALREQDTPPWSFAYLYGTVREVWNEMACLPPKGSAGDAPTLPRRRGSR